MRIKANILLNKGLRIIIFSVSSLIFSYIFYSKFTNPNFNDIIMFTPALFNISIGILIITFISSIAICFGLWNLYVSKELAKKNLKYLISLPFKEKKYILIMILSGILYGIVVSFLSQVFVFTDNASNFVGDSKFNNSIGYVPITYVYLTDYFFIFLIPINIVLILIVSFLVGFNISLNTFMIKKLKVNKQSRVIGGIGATCGLFIGCPTCAGSIIAAIFGLSAGTTTISLLASLQTIFIVISIPALMIAPFIIAKTFKNRIIL